MQIRLDKIVWGEFLIKIHSLQQDGDYLSIMRFAQEVETG
jgi:hypothetical protein